MNEREQRALDALVDRANRFVIVDEQGRNPTRSDSTESLASLRAALRLRLDGHRTFCMCGGTVHVVLFAGSKRLGQLSNHHGERVRFSGGQSDGKFADGGAAWRQHGAPAAEAEWVEDQRRYAELAVERWRSLIPEALRPFSERMVAGDTTLRVSDLAEALAHAVPQPRERARQLLAWYGVGSHLWAAPPEYERQAEAVLAAQDLDVLAAVTELTLDQNALTGAARFFSSDLVPDRTALSSFSRDRLLRFTRHRHEAHLARVSSAFTRPRRRTQQQTLHSLLARTTRFEVETGGRVTARRSSKQALEALRAAARITESDLDRCVCEADARVRLFAGQRPLGTLSTVHDAHVLRFPAGVGDALLSDDGAPWRSWLAAHGVTVRLQQGRYPIQPEARDERWLAAMPPSLRGFWPRSRETSGRQRPFVRELEAALAAHVPERGERIRQLLAWFGCCDGSWTHFPAYELQAEALLFSFDTHELAAAVEASGDQRVHEGAARFFSGAEFERRRGRELEHLSPAVRAKLVNHVRGGRSEEKLGQVERRFGPAAFDPPRALEALSAKRSRDFTLEQIHLVLAGLEGLDSSWPAVFVREAIRLSGRTPVQKRWREALALLERTNIGNARLATTPAWKLAAMQAATVASKPPSAVLVALARDGSDASRDALLADFERASALDHTSIWDRVLQLRRFGQGVPLCETLFWKYVERHGPDVALRQSEKEEGLKPHFSLQRG